ncbi:sensor histidine kinase [Sphingobium sp. SCG-1]|uniref:sensor histidine kinase n=1 Tax=Sphingobium sp. SCG-1 TaxID=2072936 RepID=UPI0016709D4F|nr:PAS domain S-box protein [Sphingobium sp. SCG-1]
MADDSRGDSRLLSLILESATDFAIFTLDDDAKATSWNIGSERLLGYSSEEMIGQNSDVIFTPEDRAKDAPEWEREQARQHGRVKDERWHMRRDGTRFWGSGLLMPLKDRPDQYVKILRDFTAQHNAEQQLRESREQFRILATSIPQLVFRTRPDGNRTWGSPQWTSFTGLDDMESRGLGWLYAVHPDDRDETQARWREAVSKGEYYCEHRVLRVADGTYRWHQTRAKPVDHGEPATSEWVGTSTDIHDLRIAQDTQALLMAELQHRTRNLLAVVQAVAQQIRRSAQTVEEFSEQFSIRLRALSRVQGILARSDHHTAALSSVIEAELAAYVSEEDMQRRIRIHGPDVTLDAGATQTLALALHELTTNAVKHGALSRDEGTLEIMWMEEEDSNAPSLSLLWAERGVPISGPPTRSGYGMELVQRALPYQLGAKTIVDFEPDGLRCTIRVPFNRLLRAK